jgi:hypothetical protein
MPLHSGKVPFLWALPIIEHKANIRVIHKVTLSFTPYPLFQWHPQSKEFLLNLSMKCWNSAFNAQGSRVIIVVEQVGVKIYVAVVQSLWKKETQDETQFTRKISLVPIICSCKTFIPSIALHALLWRNGPFSPPNHLTLQITLLCAKTYVDHEAVGAWETLVEALYTYSCRH